MSKQYPKEIPNVTIKIHENDNWQDFNTKEFFANKNVILFGLPGAFTPTCSNSHVPRFNELYPVFKEFGIDEILCLSVNDTFVMNAWKKDQHAEKIFFLPDGNADFTKAMNLVVDDRHLGFGDRSRRYSMLVKNGQIEKMFVEEDVPGDPYKVSDADTMLKYIAPEYKLSDINVLTREGCPYCAKAKKLLKDNKMLFSELVLNKDISLSQLKAMSGRTSVPQVFIDGKHIGGSDDLEKYLK